MNERRKVERERWHGDETYLCRCEIQMCMKTEVKEQQETAENGDEDDET